MTPTSSAPSPQYTQKKTQATQRARRTQRTAPARLAMADRFPRTWHAVSATAPSDAGNKARGNRKRKKDDDGSSAGDASAAVDSRPAQVPKTAEAVDDAAPEGLDAVIQKQTETRMQSEFEHMIAYSRNQQSAKDTKLDVAVAAILKAFKTMIPRGVLKDSNAEGVEQISNIQTVTKAYEDANLRGPLHNGESKCVRGKDCECMFLDTRHPFVGVSYRLPWEDIGVANMCLPCQRATVLEALVQSMLSGGTGSAICWQKFGNLHSVPGEYRASAMLFCPPSFSVHAMPLPIVRHQRNNYRVSVSNGIHYLTQVNVDFQ